MHKLASTTDNLTDKVSLLSVANLMNPISTFFNSPKWAPRSYLESFTPGAGREMTWAALTSGAGAFALAAALRAYKAKQDQETDKLQKKVTHALTPVLPNPVATGVTPKHKSTSKKPLDRLLKRMTDELGEQLPEGQLPEGQLPNKLLQKSANWVDSASLAVPLGAAALAGTVGYNMVDRTIERRDKAKLTEDLATKQALMRRLIAARALNARGKLPDDAYNKLMTEVAPYQQMFAKQAAWNLSYPLNKYASEDPSVSPKGSDSWQIRSAIGLLMATLMATSVYGGYKYFSAQDPNRLKFEATKKGLREFSKRKMMDSPLENEELPSELTKEFRDLQKDVKTPTVRETPNNPTSIW